MKSKKIIIIVLLFLCTISIKSKETTQVLITGKDMKKLFIITYDEDATYFSTTTIDKEVILPITCLNNEITSIKSFKYSNSYPCLMNTLNKNYDLHITRYIDLNKKNILKDFDINIEEINYGNDILSYSSKLANNLSFTTILKYKDYISTNYSIIDLYDIFKLYNNKKTDINIEHFTYTYVVTEKGLLPLNKTSIKDTAF